MLTNCAYDTPEETAEESLRVEDSAKEMDSVDESQTTSDSSGKEMQADAVKKYYTINLNAPIVPGKSAAGFRLGILRSEIDKEVMKQFRYQEVKNDYLEAADRTKKYLTDDVILWFEHDTLTQITVMGNYKGLAAKSVGIGNTLGDFEIPFGDVRHDREVSAFVFGNLDGMCVESEDGDVNETRTDILRGKVVKAIYIYPKGL